jgi:hypothetical protein
VAALVVRAAAYTRFAKRFAASIMASQAIPFNCYRLLTYR